MVGRRIYRRLTDALEEKKNQRRLAKIRRPRRHQADTPPADGRCLLLGLPAEIRCRILEYVLRQNEPIQACQNYRIDHSDSIGAGYYIESPIKYDKWPDGKPMLSVLRACRQLHTEGSAIFYNKNTFGITIHDSGFGSYGCSDMLGISGPALAFEMYPRLRKCPNLNIYMHFADMVTCAGLGFETNKEALDATLDEIWRYWEGQGRLHVEICQRQPNWVANDVGGASLLHKLGLFRCKYVSFRGVPYSIASVLTRIIESDKPATDLQQAFRALGTFLEGTRLRDDPYDSFGDSYREAERFAAMHQVDEFMLLRKEVVESALQRLETGGQRLRERGLVLKDEALPIRDRTPVHTFMG